MIRECTICPNTFEGECNNKRKFCDDCRRKRKNLDSKLRERNNRKDYKYVLKHSIYNALYYRGEKPQVGFFAKL